MVIKVTQFTPSQGGTYTRLFPAAYITKVLQSGALRISRALEADVPELGSNEEEMTVTKELTVAVFHGNYMMERVQDENV